MKLYDILEADCNANTAARFFTSLWDELEAPPLQHEPEMVRDFKSAWRRVLPNNVPSTIMKGMTSEDGKYLVLKVSQLNFYEEDLNTARDNCDADEDDDGEGTLVCCDENKRNLDVLHKHTSNCEVIGIFLEQGEVKIYGPTNAMRPLFQGPNPTDSPKMVSLMALLAGDVVTEVDDDGEIFTIRLDL